MKMLNSILAVAAAIVLSGCAQYKWTSRVPEEIRTVAVPVFENRTQSAELGAIATQYVLREIQREGTFKIRRSGDSVIEIQGAIVDARRTPVSYTRGYGSRASEYRYTVTAEISLINKNTGKVLQDAYKYTAETTFLVQGDMLTGQRDAAQRIGADLARQVVDGLVSYPYNKR